MSTLKPLAADWFLQCRLKLRHLQLLAALDTHRNLNRAAEAASLLQPAASKLLTELEHRLGQELFDRTPRGMTPNLFGEVLIRRAHMILSELAGAREELSALARGDAGTIRIGSVDAPAVTLLMDAVQDVLHRHPGLNIHLHSAASDSLIRSLLDGELDIVLGRPVGDVPPSSIIYREIAEERLCFICRAGHALLGQGRVSLEEMLKFSWVMQPPGSMLRRRVDHMLQAAGSTGPGSVINSLSLLMTLAYVSRTDAIGVLSEPVARQHAAQGRIALVPVETNLSVGPYGLILSRQRLLSPAGLLFLRALTDAIGKGVA